MAAGLQKPSETWCPYDVLLQSRDNGKVTHIDLKDLDRKKEKTFIWYLEVCDVLAKETDVTYSVISPLRFSTTTSSFPDEHNNSTL